MVAETPVGSAEMKEACIDSIRDSVHTNVPREERRGGYSPFRPPDAGFATFSSCTLVDVAQQRVQHVALSILLFLFSTLKHSFPTDLCSIISYNFV